MPSIIRPWSHLKRPHYLSTHAKYETPISYGSKVIANVKDDNRQTNKQTNKQTGQKQYAPDHSIRGHYKNSIQYTVDYFVFNAKASNVNWFAIWSHTYTCTYLLHDRLISLSSFREFMSDGRSLIWLFLKQNYFSDDEQQLKNCKEIQDQRCHSHRLRACRKLLLQGALLVW